MAEEDDDEGTDFPLPWREFIWSSNLLLNFLSDSNSFQTF